MTKQNNPARDIARNARSIMMGAHVILALGTACVGWMLVTNWQWLAEILPPFYHNVAAIAGGMGLYYLLDQKALVFLPYAVNVVLRMFGMKAGAAVELNQKSGFMKLFDWIAVIVSVVMLAGSAYMNFVVTPDLGNMVTGTADTSTETGAMAQNNAVFMSGQTALQDAVTEAQKGVAEAEQNAQKLIEQAQKSKGAELARLAAGGNDWARMQIAGAVAAATRKGEKQIARAEARVAKAQAKLTAYIEKQGGKVIAGNEKLTGLIATTLTGHATRLNNYTGVLWYVMLGALILFLSGCVMVEIYESETGEAVKPSATIGKVLGAAQEKAGTGMLSTLSRVLGVRDRVNFGPGSPSIRVQSNGTMAIDARQGAPLFPRSEQAANAWTRDAQKQGARFPETGQNTEGQNFGDRNTETQKHRTQNTETRTEQDRTENQTEDESGVGGSTLPNPNDPEQMKAFVKRFRAASSYRGANDAKVQEQAAWLRANGYTAQIKGGNNWIITKGGKVQNGTVENEYEWDVLSSNENAEG